MLRGQIVVSYKTGHVWVSRSLEIPKSRCLCLPSRLQLSELPNLLWYAALWLRTYSEPGPSGSKPCLGRKALWSQLGNLRAYWRLLSWLPVVFSSSQLLTICCVWILYTVQTLTLAFCEVQLGLNKVCLCVKQWWHGIRRRESSCGIRILILDALEFSEFIYEFELPTSRHTP